jgi:ribosomal protein S12 methylthiotransferase accessory factor YcaO
MLAIQEAHASILAWETSNKLKEWGTEGLTSQGLLEALQQRAETVCSVGCVLSSLDKLECVMAHE